MQRRFYVRSCIVSHIMSVEAVGVWCRSPALPPSCFRGACYLEKLDVLRENGRHTVGMRLHIFYEGSVLCLVDLLPVHLILIC